MCIFASFLRSGIHGNSGINNIVNDLSFKRKHNVNDNVGRRKTPAEVDRIADKVCGMIGSTDARAFYCKAAYRLSENKMCVRRDSTQGP